MSATTTTTVTSKYQVTVPEAVRKRLGIQKGDRVAFVETEAGFIIARAERLVDWLADTMKDVSATVEESRRGFRKR